MCFQVLPKCIFNIQLLLTPCLLAILYWLSPFDKECLIDLTLVGFNLDIPLLTPVLFANPALKACCIFSKCVHHSKLDILLSVLIPFLWLTWGSMSIACAVHNRNQFEKMNLTLTLCELDEDYFNAGVDRVKRHCSQPELFWYSRK